MIKEVTIKLGATTPTDKQYESARADIELTYSIPDEVAIDFSQPSIPDNLVSKALTVGLPYLE